MRSAETTHGHVSRSVNLEQCVPADRSPRALTALGEPVLRDLSPHSA